MNRFFLLFTVLFSFFDISLQAQQTASMQTVADIAANQQKTITLTATSGKSYTLNWGDGTNDTILIGTGNQQTTSHTYTTLTSEPYTLQITTAADCDITSLNCQRNNITAIDVTGLISLTSFNCYLNRIQSLKLSTLVNLDNIYFDSNLLTSLNLSGLVNLTSLYCSDNQIDSLDLTGLNKLTKISCYNNQLKSIHFGSIATLTDIECNSNLITNLDLSGLSGLTTLNCSDNAIKELQIGTHPLLTFVNCADNQLKQLDFSNTGIQYIICYNNLIDSLNLTGITTLQSLNCDNNQLSLTMLYSLSELLKANSTIGSLGSQTTGTPQTFRLDSGSPVKLDYSTVDSLGSPATATFFSIQKNNASAVKDTDYILINGRISFLKSGMYTVSMINSAIQSNAGDPALVNVAAVTVWNTQPLSVATLTTIADSTTLYKIMDINAPLDKLFEVNWGDSNINTYTGKDFYTTCQYTYSTPGEYTISINMDGDCDITQLYFRANNLTSLVLKENRLPNLNTLDCGINKLTSLHVNNLSNLKYLDCSDNQFQKLDINGLSNLYEIYCGYNLIDELSLTNLNTLAILNCTGNKLSSLDVTNLSGLESLYCSENEIRAIKVANLSHLGHLECETNLIDTLDLSGLRLNYLNCSSNQIAGLELSQQSNLGYLDCSFNNLTTLEVTPLTQLYQLNCTNNKLTSLDVSMLSGLNELNCNNNALTTLTLGTLENLSNINCSDNSLTMLDVSGVTILDQLYCYNNQIATLELGTLSNIATLSCFGNQLTTLNISNLTSLGDLYCYNNHIPLNTLYTLSQHPGLTFRGLGLQTVGKNEQFILNKEPIASVDYSSVDTINGVPTLFTVMKGDSNAKEGTDYTLNKGVFTFLTVGVYTVEMTNSQVVSDDEGAKVLTQPIIVLNALLDTAVSFTVQLKKPNLFSTFSVMATPNQVFAINWGDNSTQAEPGSSNLRTFTHTYTAEGSYTISLGLDMNCDITYLDCSNNQVSALDIVNMNGLSELHCNSNQLDSLSLENAPNLSVLSCYENQIKTLDITNLDHIKILLCYKNRIPLDKLYSISNHLSTLQPAVTGALGVQHISEPLTLHTNEWVDYSSVASLGGTSTLFSVNKSLNQAKTSDYTNENGKITFLAPGEYSIEMSNNAIKSNPEYPAKVITANITVATNININKPGTSPVNVYPNPTTGIVHLEGVEGKTEITLYNVTGEVVLRTRANRFNITPIPKGVYLLKVQNTITRIVKQ